MAADQPPWRDRQHFSGFLHVPPGDDLGKFFEFEDKPPKMNVRYGKD